MAEKICPECGTAVGASATVVGSGAGAEVFHPECWKAADARDRQESGEDE